MSLQTPIRYQNRGSLFFRQSSGEMGSSSEQLCSPQPIRKQTEVTNTNTYKRRLRRVRSKTSNRFQQFTILHSNIRGYSSKSVALGAILNAKKPTVLTLNATMLVNNKELKIKGRYCFTSNRLCSGGGGIATCIRKSDKSSTLIVFKGEDDLELIISRHSQFSTPINIFNIYGAVESR